jgi:hypothetical protein
MVFEADSEISKMCSVHEDNKKYLQHLVENLKGRNHLGVICLDWRIILKSTSEKKKSSEGVN